MSGPDSGSGVSDFGRPPPTESTDSLSLGEADPREMACSASASCTDAGPRSSAGPADSDSDDPSGTLMAFLLTPCPDKPLGVLLSDPALVLEGWSDAVSMSLAILRSLEDLEAHPELGAPVPPPEASHGDTKEPTGLSAALVLKACIANVLSVLVWNLHGDKTKHGFCYTAMMHTLLEGAPRKQARAFVDPETVKATQQQARATGKVYSDIDSVRASVFAKSLVGVAHEPGTGDMLRGWVEICEDPDGNSAAGSWQALMITMHVFARVMGMDPVLTSDLEPFTIEVRRVLGGAAKAADGRARIPRSDERQAVLHAEVELTARILVALFSCFYTK